jgi:hypothetical protein
MPTATQKEIRSYLNRDTPMPTFREWLLSVEDELGFTCRGMADLFHLNSTDCYYLWRKKITPWPQYMRTWFRLYAGLGDTELMPPIECFPKPLQRKIRAFLNIPEPLPPPPKPEVWKTFTDVPCRSLTSMDGVCTEKHCYHADCKRRTRYVPYAGASNGRQVSLDQFASVQE